MSCEDGKKYIRTQNDRDYPVMCPGVKFAYGAFANTTYANGKGTQNLQERHGMAAISTASASLDEMWEAMGDEVVEFTFDDGEKIKVRKRKESTKYPFGKMSCSRKKKVDVNKLPDDELEKFVYGSTNKYYDIMQSIAIQKATRTTGLGLLGAMPSRDKLFDMLYLIHYNALTMDNLATVLNVGREYIEKLIFTGCSLGMCFYCQDLLKRYEISRPDGSSDWKSKKVSIISIGGWVALDKNVVLGAGRQYGLRGMDMRRAKMPVDEAQRQLLLDEMHKIAVGQRSKYDEAIAYNMDELGSERNGFRVSERTRPSKLKGPKPPAA